MRPSRQGSGYNEDGRRLGAYARRAIREALNFGLTTRELGRVLDGHDPTELVPPQVYEDPLEYGTRAASEFMVRYILDDRRP